MIPVALSPLTYDTYGPVQLSVLAKSYFPTVERRVSRTRTLDQGYAIDDFGQADCDGDFRLVWTPDPEVDARVDWLVRSYPQIHVACASGFYLCAPESYDPRPTESTLRLLVLERLAS